MKEDDLLTAVCELIRVQKHDILNHLQVIAGYLQMNKMEKARDYLQETIKGNNGKRFSDAFTKAIAGPVSHV
ncbi:MAG: Spo0B domain-containing protein [Bacillota bacterium]